MLLMTQPSEESSKSFDELPLVLDSADLARLLRRTERTIRRWNNLGIIPTSACGSWFRDEIVAWINAGRPKRDVWNETKPRRFRHS